MTAIAPDSHQEKKPLNVTMLIMQCIGIIAVVLGHADLGKASIPNPLNLAFPYYTWHMPFFIFISGYFFNRRLPAGEYILRKCRTLLLPALVVNAISGLFSMSIKHFDLADYGKDITLARLFITPFTTGYQFYINVSLWFIFTLFTIELVACLADRLTKCRGDVAFTVITLIISLLCCHCVFYDHAGTREQYINAALRFGFLMFFFWFGALYRSRLEKHVKRFLNLKTALLLFCGMSLFYGVTGYSAHYNTRNMKLSTITVPDGFWVPVVVPLIAFAFFLSIAYALTPHLKDSKTLRWLGTNTRYVVYWHQLCLILFSFLLLALYHLGVIPKIAGFSSAVLRTSQYYASSNNYIAIVNVIQATILPIWICTSIRKIRPKWLACLVSAALIALVVGYLWLVSVIIP